MTTFVRARVSIFILFQCCLLSAFLGICSCGPQTRPCLDAGDCLAGEGCSWRKGSCVPGCKEDGDCISGQTCHTNLKMCLAKCETLKDCEKGEQCEPNDKICVKTPCLSGVLPQEGKCPCREQKQCPQDMFCDNFGKRGGLCQAVCPVSGATPKDQGCPCPKGLLWIKGECVPDCSNTMMRRSDALCVPDLSKLMPDTWEKMSDGKFRLNCPGGKHWNRDAQGQCQFNLPEVPAIPTISLEQGPPSKEEMLKQVGPQKPCPTNSTEKWDEDYLKREKLPANTSVVYVESSAASNGDGTKQKPFQRLQEGVDRVAEGGVVLVASGTYRWGLEIKKRLSLVGRCTEGVKIVPVSGSQGAGIRVRGAGASLDGFSVLGQVTGYGIYIDQTGASRLQHIHIAQAHEFGVIVEGGGVTIEHVEVSGTTKARFGRGISLQDISAPSTIRYSHLQKNSQMGFYALRSQEVMIENNLVQENGTTNKDGFGIILVQSKGKVVVRKNHILKNGQVGLFLSMAQEVIVEGNLLQDNGATNREGRGVVFQDLTGKAELRHNHIVSNAQYGLFISVAQEVIVEGNRVEGNGTANQEGRGLNVQDLKGKVTVRHNHILKNAQHGLFVHNSQEVEIQANLIQENGAQDKKGQGITLLNVKRKAMVRSNHIIKNAQSGVFMSVAQDVEIQGNLIQENGAKNMDAQGIALQDLKGDAVIRDNHIIKNAQNGLFVGRSQGVEVQRNLILENGTQLGNGLSLQVLGGKVFVQHNDIRKNAQNGLFVSDAHDVEVKGNLIQENGAQDDEENGLTFLALKGKAVVQGNHIIKNAKGGIFVGNSQEVEVQGNLFLENGIKNKGGRGINLQDLAGKAAICYNHILKSPQVGVFVSKSEEVEVRGNLIEENGSKDITGQGIELLQLQAKSVIVGNTIAYHPIGGSIVQSSVLKDGELQLQENVWAKNSHIGLRLNGNEAGITLQTEQFLHNGSAHLRIVNNRGSLRVNQSYFVKGLYSEGLSNLGQGLSAGMGIWVGALGLVRWVFAKDADYPCSLVQKGLVKTLPDNWTMRLVRIPNELDPCKVWRFGPPYRTEELRKQAGECQKKCPSPKRCRWIWKGDGTKKGLWVPDSLQCVSADAPDTCDSSVAKTLPLGPVVSEGLIRGECIKLTEKEDPCNTSDMKVCNQQTTPSGAKKSYCIRKKIDLNKPVEGVCVLWENSNNSCRPPALSGEPEPCQKGSVCISDMKVSLPGKVYPSRLNLTGNVFWGNPGPDVMMDMAGRVVLTDNQYYFCTPSKEHPTCSLKVGYQPCVLSKDDPKCQLSKEHQRGFKPILLPVGATMVWQNPSPHNEPFDSLLQGNDINQTIQGKSLLYKPNTCQALTTQ